MFSVYYKVEIGGKCAKVTLPNTGSALVPQYTEHNQTFGFEIGSVPGVDIVRRLAKKHGVNPKRIVICSVIPDFQTPGNIYWHKGI